MFFEYSPGRAGGPLLGLGGSNPFIGLEHFRNMISGVSLEARLFRTSLRNTLIFAFAVLPLNLLITLPLAALIESLVRQRGRLLAPLLPARGNAGVGWP
jgi:ABC-type sugar transport system permease subunit